MKLMDNGISMEENEYQDFLDGKQMRMENEVPEPPQSAEAKITLYDINKQLCQGLPDMTDKEINQKRLMIVDWASRHKDNYYMMLCKEANYYTVFVDEDYCGDMNKFADQVIDIIQYLGHVKSINLEKDEYVEIWCAPEFVSDGEVHMFALFPYSGGVVTF